MKDQAVKIKLTLPIELYRVLQEKSQKEYMRVATWTAQFLMKNLYGDNKKEKMFNTNGRSMENRKN
jgi:hypothetical protein